MQALITSITIFPIVPSGMLSEDVAAPAAEHHMLSHHKRSNRSWGPDHFQNMEAVSWRSAEECPRSWRPARRSSECELDNSSEAEFGLGIINCYASLPNLLPSSSSSSPSEAKAESSPLLPLSLKTSSDNGCTLDIPGSCARLSMDSIHTISMKSHKSFRGGRNLLRRKPSNSKATIITSGIPLELEADLEAISRGTVFMKGEVAVRRRSTDTEYVMDPLAVVTTVTVLRRSPMLDI